MRSNAGMANRQGEVPS